MRLEGTPGGPRRGELPWHYRPWFIVSHGMLVVALVVAVVLVEWQIKRMAPWPQAVIFAVGAGIGLTGVRPMVRLHQASWPFQRLRWELTGGRFLTLKCPILSPAYWKAVRHFRQTRAAEGLPPGPTLREQLLAFLPLPVACCVGVTAGVWLGVPASPMLAFLGCMLTWGTLSLHLWWRGLPE